MLWGFWVKNTLMNKNITEIIQRRYSCRTYDNQAIAIDTRDRLTAFIEGRQTGPFGFSSRFKLVSASSGDADELKGLGTYGFIHGATGYIIGVTVNTGKSLEDFGYLMEFDHFKCHRTRVGHLLVRWGFKRSTFADRIQPKKMRSSLP